MFDLDAIVGTTKYETRPYQLDIVRESVDRFTGRYKNGSGQLQDAMASVMIESPTGSGKSCMAMLTAKVLQTLIPDLHVAWVAMRRNLLTQAAREQTRMEVGLRNVHYVSMFDKRPESVLAAKAEGHRLLMVVDEAQHDAAATMAHLHTMLEPLWALGMTATPYRTDSLKLCFSGVVKRAGIHQLIGDGYLSPFEHFTIPEWSPKAMAETFLREPTRWGQSIAYFLTLDDCREATALLEAGGIGVELVTGTSDRDTQIARFERGESQVIVNCMVLTEGFDCPSLKTAFIRPSSRGPTIQMGGRVFRKHPELPFKQIVQCKKTEWPFQKTATPKMGWVWDEAQQEWASLMPNPLMDVVTRNALMHVAHSRVEMPAYFTKKRKKTFTGTAE